MKVTAGTSVDADSFEELSDLAPAWLIRKTESNAIATIHTANIRETMLLFSALLSAVNEQVGVWLDLYFNMSLVRLNLFVVINIDRR
jgi:hypothetical protein